MEFIVLMVIVAVFIFGSMSAFKTSDPLKVRKSCVKQPDKDCPYVVSMHPNGGMSASGHNQCCQVRDQLKAMNKAFCDMEPGKTYGEISITKEFHESCLAKQKYFEDMDSSGPAE